MNMTCGAFFHLNDACYDCFNTHSKNDSRLKHDCDGPGEDGLHDFCDPEHNAKKCYNEMNQNTTC